MIGADRSVKGGVSAMVNNLYGAGLDRRVDRQSWPWPGSAWPFRGRTWSM